MTSLSLLFLFLLTQSYALNPEQPILDEDYYADSHAVTAAGTDSSDSSTDKVYLRSITALIFSENSRTNTPSGPGNPQLQCVGGSAAGFWWFTEYYPHMVQCKNIGWDGASIQWGCEAALSEYVQFGPDTQVTCEPYDSNNPDDGYVFRGSCRLKYTLNFKKFHISFVHIMYVSNADVPGSQPRRKQRKHIKIPSRPRLFCQSAGFASIFLDAQLPGLKLNRAVQAFNGEQLSTARTGVWLAITLLGD